MKRVLKSFWEIHDPTQLNRQGNDVGNNYRSAIFYTNATQERAAKDTKQQYQNLLLTHGFCIDATVLEFVPRTLVKK